MKAVRISQDDSVKRLLRSLPVSIKTGSPLFVWEGMTLQWVEAKNEILAMKESQHRQSMQRSRDNQGHVTKLCFVPDCKGTEIKAGHLTRHLRDVHHLTEGEIKCWRTSLKSHIREIKHDPFVE